MDFSFSEMTIGAVCERHPVEYLWLSHHTNRRCLRASLRPTLMGAFGILFCNNFKRVFIFFFHHRERAQNIQLYEIKNKKGV